MKSLHHKLVKSPFVLKIDSSRYNTQRIFDFDASSFFKQKALGMAKARDIKNEDNSVIAVIGDGALTRAEWL